MTIRKIVPKTALSLRPARPVTDFNDPLVKQSIQDLFDSLADMQAEIDKTRPEASGGVGLAANQIEYPQPFYPKDFVPYDMYVVNVREQRAQLEKCEAIAPSIFINATFEPIADVDGCKQTEYQEACLSINGIKGIKTPRFEKIAVDYFDENGNHQALVAEDFIARVHQHELDHGLGREFLNQLELNGFELLAVANWIADTNAGKTTNKTILAGKLEVFLDDPDLQSLGSWVTNELQKKTTLRLRHNAADLFAPSAPYTPVAMEASPTAAVTPIVSIAQQIDEESDNLNRLRI